MTKVIKINGISLNLVPVLVPANSIHPQSNNFLEKTTIFAVVNIT